MPLSSPPGTLSTHVLAELARGKLVTQYPYQRVGGAGAEAGGKAGMTYQVRGAGGHRRMEEAGDGKWRSRWQEDGGAGDRRTEQGAGGGSRRGQEMGVRTAVAGAKG
mgnify:CR=1 FL=1